jgi:hypothetical protein
MHRSHWLGVAAIAAASGVAGVAACGDLVIPQNAGDDGGGGGSDDGGGNDDGGGPLDARYDPDCDAGIPLALACTGLYADWPTLTLAPDAHAYQPGASMWVDGATSLRWIWLPPGAKIDTTDPNNWVFPVGTKLWQELSLLGKRIETRFLWKEAPTLWFRTTYAWADDQNSAPELTIGLPNARGLPYEIPAVSACEKCHDGANDFVLGFEAVGLSMPQSSGQNLVSLALQGLLTKVPTAGASVPGDPTTSASLAFLHANCGTSCHNRNTGAGAGQTGLFMKLTVDATGALPPTAQTTDTWLTAYKVPSVFTPGGSTATVTSAVTVGDGATGGAFYRLEPGDLAHSMIPWRAGRRDGVTQMPPIATHLVDEGDMQVLDAWVTALPP